LHRFLDSTVKLAIGADDPGVFNSPLAAEVDWVVENTGMDADDLALRLGNPRRFRLGNLRAQ
jgi:adenosine deaminase